MNTNTLRNAISTALLAVATGTTGLVQADDTRSDPRPSDGHGPGEGADRAPSASAATDETPVQLETLAVTGSRIRDADLPSPVIAIDRQQIQSAGFADLGEVIRSVPQNFTGGQNPGALSGNLAGAGNANQNITGGSSLNLRGLGPDATLTLVNGRRMAYGGFSQSVDISAIPLEAVQRIEIVADGASAIYGSDAVGGVGNVILRRDYRGFSAGARYGTATQGGLGSREYSLTTGGVWNGGGLIAAFRDSSVDPIYARQRPYTEQLVDPATLYPGSDLRSGLVSAHQALGGWGELRLDALRTEREQLHYYNWAGRSSVVTPDTTTTLLAPGLDLWLGNDWTLSLGGSAGRDRHHQVRLETVTATGATSLTDVCYCNDSRMAELGAEGPLFALPGGQARLAVGAGYRANRFRIVNRIAGADTTTGRERAQFAYAEANLPLVGPGQGVRGLRRLSLSAAARHEDYDTFGGVTTPKLGLVAGPSDDVTVKASWGRSFKAPTLLERNFATTAFLFRPASFGGTGFPDEASVLVLDGGNRDLEPERATTRSLTLAYHPEAVPGLEAELTWFHIDYRNRVIQPITNPGQALSDPVYAPFIRRAPTLQDQEAVLAAAGAFSNFTGAPYDPDDVVAILFTQYANVARQDIRGFDLSGAYRMDLRGGALTVRASASWLDSSQQTLPGQPSNDLSGVLFNPPRLSGRVGAVWQQGGFTASVFGNHRGGVTNRLDGVKSGSLNTFDATLRHDTGDRGDAWSGLVFALSVDNVFDRDPPHYQVAQPIYVPPYDSTNYSPIGRFVSVSVSKRW